MRSGRATAAARGPRAAGDRPGEGAPGALGLLALVAASAVLAAALWALAGAPALPDGARLRGALEGSELSDADLVAAAAALCWLLLGYLALSVALRLAALFAARLSRGAAWARTGLRLSTLVTIPAVRRLVDGGVGGALLAASWLPLPAGAGYAQAPVHVAAAAAPAHAAVEKETALASASLPDREAAPSLRYTVAAGDDLWGIARRCYGDGTRFVELFEANRDRVMASGERFTDPRRIRPDWVLSVPGPVSGVSAGEETLGYRVRAGDHLWGIAERWLGDGFLWVEIWERNRGREMGEGRRFTDPNVIAPGWLLELPLAGPSAAPHPVSAGAAASPPREPAGPAGTADPDRSGPAPEGVEAARAARGGAAEWPRLPHTALLSAAGVAVLGGAALFVRRLHGSGSPDPGGDAGRAALAAGALQEAFSEFGFHGSRPLLLREGRRGIAVTAACPPGDAEALAARRHDLARRLGCELEADASGPARVALTISRPGRFPGLLGSGSGARAALAVPAGATADEIVYLNLEAAGSVTVSGSPREQRALLRSWLRTLSTLCPPDELSLRADAGAAEILEEETSLPHFAGGGGSDAAELADELDEIVSSRRGHPGHPLVAIFALDREDAVLPEAAMRHGPEAGVYVIRCLPPGEFGEEPQLSGATLSLGAADGGTGGDGGDGGATGPGGIALRIGRDDALLLDPVRVRWDASPRWSESAEQASAPGPPLRVPHDLSRPPDPVDERGADEPGPADAPDDEPAGAENAGTAPPPLPHAPLPGGTQALARAEGDAPGAPAPALRAGGAVLPSSPGGPPGRGNVDPAAAEPERGEPPPGPGAGPAAAAVAAGAFSPHGQSLAPEEPVVPHPPGAPRALDLGRQGALLADGDLFSPEPAAAAGTDAMFTVRCLGHFELRYGDTPLTHWPREKSRELLAFLATHGGASVPRETVAEAMWPEYPADASLRHMLANAVAGLRSMVRSAASDDALQPVVTALQRCQLQTSLFRIDLDAFELALRRAASLPDGEALSEYERAVALYAGDFLESEFFPWAESYRRDYRQRLLDGANRAAAAAARLGEGARARQFYRVVLEHDPTDEEAACAQMSLLAAAGHIHGARRVYHALAEALKEELDDPGACPSPETRTLLDELVAGSGAVTA